MADEANPQINRMMTRSTSVVASKNTVETAKKKRDPYSSSVNDLVFGEDPISLGDLFSSFPGRHNEICEILRLLGPLNSPMLPLFIYGGTSTGKTSVVLQIFRHLNRPFVYSSCLSCYNPRILFESILNQLLLHEKNAENGYSSVKRCEKPSDFVNHLRGALVTVLESLQRNLGKSSAKKITGQANGNKIYLIFDHLELVREWDKHSTVLSLLLNLYEILKVTEVGLVFISNASPDTYYSSMSYAEPIPVYFPDYTEDDLRQILMQNQTNKKLFSSFLDIVLRPFFRVTRRLNELSIVLLRLFKIYTEPLSDLGVVPTEDMKRRLYSHIQPHIAPALNDVFKISIEPSPNGEISKGKRRKGAGGNEGSEAFNELEFHMSVSAKYLLISAFLASRNPATLDASLFDSTGGSNTRKRKMNAGKSLKALQLSFDKYFLDSKSGFRASEKSMEKKEMAEQELLMKGPGTFPLERLIAIFQCITSIAEIPYEIGEDTEEMGTESMDSTLMSDVLLQLSSLYNANFIVKGGSCPLEGSTRYRSTVSEETALKVARSLKFPLSKYLYRR